MVNENALRDVLVTLAEISKDQYRLLVDLASEIAALEKAVSALDPTFADSFVIRRQQAAQKALASSQPALARYDNLIQKMKGGLVS